MELMLSRNPALEDGTILGELLVDHVFECFTLERADVAIPLGRFSVMITPSFRFERLLPIVNVPGRFGIRIHPGNVEADTEGCILVGQGKTADGVVNSRLAMAHLQPQIAGALARGERVWLTVTAATMGTNAA